MKKYICVLGMMISVSATMMSCEKDKNEDLPVTQTPGAYDNGIFICNEGPFMAGTGTVSYYNPESNLFYKDVYDISNHVALGNIVQSMTVIDGKGFIVVNNSNKIEVVDMTDFKSVATIDNVTLPRYIIKADDETAYISCWDNTVAIVSLSDYSVTGHISCATGPEMMLKQGNYVYVLNQGGYAIDSLITVIDTRTDQVFRTLTVGERPTGVVADKNGNIWIMCSGKGYNGWPQPGDSRGKLVKISTSDFSVEYSAAYFSTDIHPEKLAINSTSDTLFFLYNGGICKRSINSSSANVNPFIYHQGGIYALGFDKKHNYLLFSDPVDYVQDGWIYLVNPVSGKKSDSISTGIIPGFFYIN